MKYNGGLEQFQVYQTVKGARCQYSGDAFEQYVAYPAVKQHLRP